MINFDKIRTILNILFMLMTAVAVVMYFTIDPEDTMLFVYVCGVAICIKLMEFVIRFIHR